MVHKGKNKSVQEPDQSAKDKEMLTLYRIHKFLSSIHDLDKLLYLIMEEATKSVQAEASSIALYNPRTKKLHFTIALGKMGHKLKKVQIELGKGIIGLAAKDKRPLCLSDVRKDRRFNTQIDKKIGFISKAILAVPLIHKKKLIGALEVINKTPASGVTSFQQNDIRLLEIVASQAALAIENAKLYQKVFQKHSALRNKHKQLIAIQEKLLQMEKLSAIGSMASRVIHDLRNSLTIISGYVDLLMEKEVPASKKQEFSKIITAEINRLAGMTNEVLAFTRGESKMAFADYSLGLFINEVCNFLKRDFQENNIKLATELNYTGAIRLDKDKMQRAIFNLSFNAKDAMPNGGTFKIATKRSGKNVEIKLSDTGYGIPREIKHKIFQPFVTYGKAHGSGLGLAIVKSIVQVHKGSISIDSIHSKSGQSSRPSGSTFTIKLPLA